MLIKDSEVVDLQTCLLYTSPAIRKNICRGHRGFQSQNTAHRVKCPNHSGRFQTTRPFCWRRRLVAWAYLLWLRCCLLYTSRCV